MYKRNPHKKLQTKKRKFLNVTSLRNNGSPKAGVSCLIHQVRSTFLCFGPHSCYWLREYREYVSGGIEWTMRAGEKDCDRYMACLW